MLLAVLVSVATPLLTGFTHAKAESSAEQLPTDDALRRREEIKAIADSGRWIVWLVQAASEFDVPLPVLRAVLSVESGGDSGRRNPATHAIGLMQVRSEIVAASGAGEGTNLYLPDNNIMVAAAYLRKAHDLFGNWDIAYAAFSGAINLDRSTPAYRDPADFGDVARFREALASQGYIPNPAPTNGTALNWAFEALGSPYLYAGATLDGFDCSGLVYWAYHQVGVALPRDSVAQWDATMRVSAEELQPGDIIFFGADLYHVGLYAGNGYMLHSPREGSTVEIVSLSEAWWSSEIVGYGRVP